MAKTNTEPENSQSHKKTPRIHKKIMCDVCGAKISSAHKSKHKKTKACQEAGKLIDKKILLRIEKNENKNKKTYADHVNAKDDLLKMINLIEEKIIIKKKPQMAAGMNDIKSLFMSSIIVPIRTRDRKNRPFSFFLYGPSGNGKSMIVRNLCAESEITLFEVTMKGLMRYHAEELALCDLIFQMAAHYSPSVILFDKADLIFNNEATTTTAERATSYLKLIEENSYSENPIFIIATTAKPQEVSREFLTNFSRLIHVGIPSKSDRMEILKSKFPPGKFADDVDFSILADKTQGFSGHDLDFLCTDVHHSSLENYTHSNMEAISSAGFTLTNKMLEEIEELNSHKLTMNQFIECLSKRVPNASEVVNEYLEKWSPHLKEKVDTDFHQPNCMCFDCMLKRSGNSIKKFEGAFKGRGFLIGGTANEK